MEILPQGGTPMQIEKANGTPVLPPAPSRKCFRDLSAAGLYMLVRPTGGLLWHELSPGQQKQFTDRIDQAAAATAVEGQA